MPFGCRSVLSPLLAPFARDRFSPVRFDVEHVLSGHSLDALLDAARRAPSAGNSQPWRFIIGRRGDAIHGRLVRHLARSSSRWAPEASVLLVNLSQSFVEDSELEYSEFSRYDLGQAVAHMTFQAHASGLAVHQFRAFDKEALAAEFSVPRHWDVTSMSAVGVPLGLAESHRGAGTSGDRLTRAAITWSRSIAPEDGSP